MRLEIQLDGTAVTAELLQTSAGAHPAKDAPHPPAAATSSTASSISAASSGSDNMNLRTSCGEGAIHTGANDWRCSGEGPYLRRFAMWCGVLYPLFDARP